MGKTVRRRKDAGTQPRTREQRGRRHGVFDPESCPTTGKVGFDTRKRAREHARRHHPGQQLRAYQCEGCDHWHNGSIPPDVIGGDIGRGALRDRAARAAQP
jgi:hypothetical protein